jgi:hypothetical protein
MEMTRLNENAFRFEISAWRREIHTTSAIPKKRAGQVSLCQPAPRRSHARIIPGAVGRFGDKNYALLTFQMLYLVVRAELIIHGI